MWQISWKTCVSEVCVTHFDDVSYKQILAAPNYTVCRAGRKGVLCQPMRGRVAATSLSSELMPDGVNIQLLSRDLF